MLKLWGRKSSSNVQAVMWCLAEIGLRVERIDAGFRYGITDTPDYLSMNPNGTVPTLQDGSNPPLWESGAILRYLANQYAPEAFWPSDPHARANVDRWAEWSKINVAINFTSPIFWRVVRTPQSRRDPSAIRAATVQLEKFLAIADSQLGKFAYIADDFLTLADIQFGHCLYRYFDIDIERCELNHLRRYYDMLTERPAYRENVMISYQELVDTK